MGREPRRISFQEFIEDALFHPAWGYYSRGNVRFGLGGDYDTYPLALSPFFGQMLAAQAHRVWRHAGAPTRFEICEIGAGNGQLALDVLVAVATRSRRPMGVATARRTRRPTDTSGHRAPRFSLRAPSCGR